MRNAQRYAGLPASYNIMGELPMEIWTEIASLVEHEDLRSLAMVSRALSTVSWRILSEKIVLSLAKRDHHESYLKFLVNSNLIQRCRVLCIKWFEDGEASRIPFVKMTNLRALTIQSCAAFSGASQSKAIHAIRTSCKELRTIKVHATTAVFSGRAFAIPDIKKVVWDECGNLTPSFLSLCAASLSSIKCLTICIHAPYHCGGGGRPELLIKFSKLRFPKLSYLDIGPGRKDFMGKRNLRRAFTQFLLAHNRIETLILRQTDWRYPTAVHLEVDHTVMTPNILPNLLSLDAHSDVLEEFARASPLFWITLESLRISEGVFINEEEDDRHPSNAPENHPPFPFLDELSLQLPLGGAGVTQITMFLPRMNNSDNWDSSFNLFAEYIDTLGSMFPKLESWVGDVPLAGHTVVHYFSNIPKLRTITCSVGNNELEKYMVQYLAEKCALLESVTCVVAEQTFTVVREEQYGKPVVHIIIEDMDFDELDEESQRYVTLRSEHLEFVEAGGEESGHC